MAKQSRKLGELEDFPATLSPMLARLVDEPVSDPLWLFEPKLGGFRNLAFVRNGEVTLCSGVSGVGPDFPLPRRAL